MRQNFVISSRDGGLKRQKVKDSYKEEQQKMYSSIIVGQNGSSPNSCWENTEDAGDSGLSPWPHRCWCDCKLRTIFTFLFEFFWRTSLKKEKTRMYIGAPPAGGSIRQHNPVHPLYLSYQCDIVRLIFKSPVWWSKLLFFMFKFLFLKNVIDRFFNSLPFIHLIPTLRTQTWQEADGGGGRDTRNS